METMLEILKYTLPAIIVLLATFIIIRAFMENETKRRSSEIVQSGLKTMIPVRMQAYERLVLFLERTLPENLVLRSNRPGMKGFELKAEMIKNIREEFEHNMSQQLYVSEKAWALIGEAREEMIHLINTSGRGLDDKAGSREAAAAIMGEFLQRDNIKVKEAIRFLKKEFDDLT